MLKKVELDEKDFEKIFQKDMPVRRLWRTTVRVVKRFIGMGLIFLLFFIILNASAYWQRLNFVISKPEIDNLKSIEPPKEEPIIEYDPAIEIPKINITAPLVVNVEPDLILQKLKDGVVHYAQTALPGERGNAVLVGHSSDFPWSTGQYKTVFALLDKLETGDQLIIAFGRQKLVYTVSEIKVVKPTEVEVLRASSQPILTLITCYPVGTTTNRLIVIATLSSGKITGVQTTEPNIAPLPQAR